MARRPEDSKEAERRDSYESLEHRFSESIFEAPIICPIPSFSDLQACKNLGRGLSQLGTKEDIPEVEVAEVKIEITEEVIPVVPEPPRPIIIEEVAPVVREAIAKKEEESNNNQKPITKAEETTPGD